MLRCITAKLLLKPFGEELQGMQCKEKKRVKDSQYFKDKMLLMEAKEKGTVLDAEAEAFLADVECTAPYDQPLAITTTNMFEVSHEDAYDSDVDEGPHAAAAFMANLSSTSGTNGATTSQVNEVHTDANQIFDNVNHLLTHEMHQEEHLDSDVESDIDDNTIPYHQYQLDSEVQDVPTEVSSAPPGEISMITILDDLRTQLDGHLKVNQEQCLVNDSLRAELAKCKLEIVRLDTQQVKLDLERQVRQEQNLVTQRNERNAELEQEKVMLKTHLKSKDVSIEFLKSENQKVLTDKKKLEDKYLDEIVCLKSANKVATDLLQKFQMPTHTIPMLSKKPKIASQDLHKDILGRSNPRYGKKAPVINASNAWDTDETLASAEVSMAKMKGKPGHVRPESGFYEKLDALKFVPQQELSREQVYWLPANKIASQASTPATPVTPYVPNSPPPSQFALQQVVPFLDYFKKHVQTADDTIVKEVAEFKEIHYALEDEYEQIFALLCFFSLLRCYPSFKLICDNLRLDCDRESYNKVPELEAEISKQKWLITESEKRFAFLEQNYVSLQLKFQNYKQCSDTSSASNAIFEINKLRNQLQGKDATIRNLDAQINIMKVLNVGSTEGSCDQQALDTDRIQLQDTITSLRIQLDGLKVENVSLKKWYDELSKANTHSRTAYINKLSALTAEHKKLQAQVTGKTSSGPSNSETPKVLAPGMYNLGSKYIPPPKRANWVKSTPLPKKKQVTFDEPPRPSLKPTQKPVVHHNKQTNVCVALSTGVKPTSGANKPVPKRAPRNHSSLPAKSTNARRVEAHHRILNKKNRVDSNLLVKHSVSVSNSNNDCGACNKSLVFSNHNACLVLCDDSVNVKPHQTKRITHQPTKEWKPIKRVGKPIKRVWNHISKNVANTKPQWKPTGRHFSLYEMHPLTRILEPSVEPIELSPSVKSSAHITMISRAPITPEKCCCYCSSTNSFSGYLELKRDAHRQYVPRFDRAMVIINWEGTIFLESIMLKDSSKPILIGQFCDGGLEVAFRQHSCHIRNYDMLLAYKSHLNEVMFMASLVNPSEYRTLNELARNDLVRGLPMLKYDKDHLCPSCQLGKSKKASHPLKAENTNTEVLHTLHMDLCGPIKTKLLMRFEKFIGKTQRALNATVRFVRTDNGTEFVNKTLDGWFESVGISHETSVPRSTTTERTLFERQNAPLNGSLLVLCSSLRKLHCSYGLKL
ncbi:uncharacterized mitochondrial protein-like protein [Tanacetum coccineum]|uniref:Uncharacterized mitochondrial protein-like protein n=1 Tax=Tanacetum coccineum TaxID=301880 RepID=A0ABQ5E722_9ASTR